MEVDREHIALQKCRSLRSDLVNSLKRGKPIMLSFLARIFGLLCFVTIAATAASQGAYAACYASDQQMSPQAVSDFLNNPTSLLSKPENAQGGGSLIDAVRDLVASNPSTLPAVIGVLKSANDGQQKAIGTGLGLAANLCTRPDPNFAADISEQLAQSESDPAKTSYAAIIGKPTGSVAGGGAGGGVSSGGVGGPTTPVTGFSVSSSPLQAFTSGGAFTTGTNYFTSSAGGASVAPGTPSTNTTTASSSVSK
jgi:hypothetical protein